MSPTSGNTLVDRLSNAQATIFDLQKELQETNKGLLALTMELEDDLDEGRAEADRLKTLNLLTQKISATLDLDEVLEFIVHATADLLNVPFVGAFIFKDDKLEIRVEHGNYYSKQGRVVLGVGEGLVGRVASSGEIAYVEDAQNDPMWKHVEVVRKEGIHSCLGVPLKQGEVVRGVLNCMDIKIREFGEDEMDLISAFAHAAEVAIQNASRYEEVQALQRMTESIANAITDSVLDGIITIDTRGNIESYNPAAERIFGFSAEEAIGKNVSMLMPKPDSEKHDDFIGNYLRTGEAKILGIDREAEGRRQDGSIFPINLSVTEVRLEDRRLFTGVIRDITERKRADADLMRAKEEAERASNVKSEFVANMSHELRTPLNSIIGFSEMLEDETFGGLNEKQMKHVTNILGSGRHLLGLINNILDISKLEAGRMELETSLFEVPGVLNNVLDLIKSLAFKKSIVLNVESEELLPAITGDQSKIKQIMYNLLSNAIKFTPDGGSVKVMVSVARERVIEERIGTSKGSFIQVSVSDTGIGIKPEDLERVFVEFEQVDSSYGQKQKGTGLGLTLTRRFVEMHGGRIWVESEPEKGSTFVFLVPEKAINGDPVKADDES